MSARDNILRRVRVALSATSPGAGDAAPSEGRAASSPDGQAAASPETQREMRVREKLANHPRGPLPPMAWETVERFKTCCSGLSSTVDEVAAMDDVPQAVAAYLREHSLPTTIVCWPDFAGLPWQAAGIDAQARSATGDDKVGITGCFCAIAETGTLMMHSGTATPLTPSLLPDVHIAVVRRSRLVRCMEDAWDLLRREHGELPRQVAFVSGPSRTADIEMTMVLGIHGPYRVHVVLVKD